MEGKQNPYTLMVWIYVIVFTMEILMESLTKLKVEVSYGSSYTTPGYTPKSNDVCIQKKCLSTERAYCGAIYNSQAIESIEHISLDEQIKEMECAYSMEQYLPKTNNKTTSFAGKWI